MAGTCSSRFVDPPNAACTTIALRSAACGQDVARRRMPRVRSVDQRPRRAPRHVEPDRLAGRRQRGVRQRQAERLADHLRRRRRAEELAAAAGRRARAAAELRRLLERDLAVREARADASAPCPASSPSAGGSVTPPGTSTHGRSCIAGQRHHHRRQSLVARRHAQHAAPRRQRPDQPPQHHRRVVAVRQAVEHAGRALRAAVARIGAIAGERHAPRGLQLRGRRLHEQPDFPVAGVIAERDRRAVGCADAAVRAAGSGTPARPAPPGSSPCRRSASSRTDRRSAASRSISAVSGSDPAGPAAAS